MQCFRGLFQRGDAPGTADSALQASPPAETVVAGFCACQAQPAMFEAGECITLYHQTSPENAEAILRSGLMRPGPPGFGGSGIYFAPDAQATSCKANHKGVILECTVTLGRVKVAKQAGNWGSKLRRALYKYDSVALTFLEGGIEYVIYDSSRVSSIKVHQMLHHCSSILGEESSSSSGSFRISTAADTGCGSSGQSSEYSTSSGSSVSGDSNCDSADSCRVASSGQAPAVQSSDCSTSCSKVVAASIPSNMQEAAQTALQEALHVLQDQQQPDCVFNDNLHVLQQSQRQMQQQASLAARQPRRSGMPSEPSLSPACQQQHGQLQAVC